MINVTIWVISTYINTKKGHPACNRISLKHSTSPERHKSNVMISKVTNSNKKVTPFGGLFFVINDLKKKGLAKIIDSHLGKRVKQAKYSYSDIILNWTYCNLCGAERLEDIEKLRDSLDIKLPSHDALGTVMKSFATKTILFKGGKKAKRPHEFSIHKPLNSLMLDMALNLKLLKKNKPYILDYDNTIIEAKKHDVTKTFKWNYGYQPGVSFIGKVPVYIEGRNGNSNAETFMYETLKRGFELLDNKGIKVNKFRSDAAAFQFNVIELMEDRNINFYIRLVRNKNFKEKVQKQVKSWSNITLKNVPIKIGEGVYTSTRFKKSYRMVVTKYTNRKGQIDYRAIITNDFNMSVTEVLSFYNQRGAIERNFDDLKNNFNWHHLPFSFLNENTVFMIISAITSIIYQYLIRKFSKKVDFVKTKHRLKNFIFHFIVCSATLNNGQLQLFTDRDYGPLVE